jgi:hypothetical protein
LGSVLHHFETCASSGHWDFTAHCVVGGVNHTIITAMHQKHDYSEWVWW